MAVSRVVVGAHFGEVSEAGLVLIEVDKSIVVAHTARQAQIFRKPVLCAEGTADRVIVVIVVVDGPVQVESRISLVGIVIDIVVSKIVLIETPEED